MKRLFGCLTLALLMAVWGCESHNAQSESEAEADTLTFVDESEGLPASGEWRHGLAFFDMNKDGYIDILAPPARFAPENEAYPAIWYGSGNGEWSKASVEMPVGRYTYGDIGTGDFNGDGIPDIGLAMHTMALEALKGNGKGKYVKMSNGLPPRKSFVSRAMVCADFNNDGGADIIAVSEALKKAPNYVPEGIVFCTRGGEEWKCISVGEKEKTKGIFADQVTVGDVNGDGNKDFAVACRNHAKAFIVWIGDGKGRFSPFNKGLPKEKHYLSVGLADIDGDGKDDLVAGVSGFGMKYCGPKAFLSGSDGFVEVSEGLPLKTVVPAIAAGDLDGDGTAEMVVGMEGGLRIFSREGEQWEEMSASGLPRKGLSMIWNVYCRDLNRDGKVDIALNYGVQGENGGIAVFVNATP